MTPEERATQIAEGLGSLAAPIVGWLASEIENAIRAAVEAERERAYKAAEAFYLEGEDNANKLGRDMLKAIKNTNAPPEAER